MIDNLVSLKAATIWRGVSRARAAFVGAPNTFAVDLPARDAAILNIQCAYQARLETGQHLIHRGRLCARQNTRKLSMIVPTLPREHATLLLLRLAKRPELGLPRWGVGVIVTASR